MPYQDAWLTRQQSLSKPKRLLQKLRLENQNNHDNFFANMKGPNNDDVNNRLEEQVLFYVGTVASVLSASDEANLSDLELRMRARQRGKREEERATAVAQTNSIMNKINNVFDFARCKEAWRKKYEEDGYFYKKTAPGEIPAECITKELDVLTLDRGYNSGNIDAEIQRRGIIGIANLPWSDMYDCGYRFWVAPTHFDFNAKELNDARAAFVVRMEECVESEARKIAPTLAKLINAVDFNAIQRQWDEYYVEYGHRPDRVSASYTPAVPIGLPPQASSSAFQQRLLGEVRPHIGNRDVELVMYERSVRAIVSKY